MFIKKKQRTGIDPNDFNGNCIIIIVDRGEA